MWGGGGGGGEECGGCTSTGKFSGGVGEGSSVFPENTVLVLIFMYGLLYPSFEKMLGILFIYFLFFYQYNIGKFSSKFSQELF